MKAWLNSVCWNLAVALGFIEPPRPQPIRVEAPRDKTMRSRR
ncbi:PA1414 family protein [Stutzerimonas marianensis]|nr:PA1414 family protein [Pseudomonas marianensis]